MSDDRPWEDFQSPVPTAPAAAPVASADDTPWTGYQSPVPANVPLPTPRPDMPPAPDDPSWARRAYRMLGGQEPSGDTPTSYLPSTDVNKPSPSERMSSTLGVLPTLGLQLFPPTGAVIGGLDAQYYQNRGEFGPAALAAAPAALPAGGKNFVAPSSEDLLKEGTANINTYRALPKTYSSSEIEQLANDIKTNINNAGHTAGQLGTAPKTHQAIDLLLEKARTQPYITPVDIDAFRSSTSLASKAGEPGAMLARDNLFKYLGTSTDPADQLLMQGVKNYGGGKRGEIVDAILEKAANRSNEGKVLESQARGLVENQAKRLRGFSDAEVAALDAARGKGAFLEGAGDVLSGSKFGIAGKLTVPAAAGAAGTAFFGPGGAALSSVPPVLGWGVNSMGGAVRRAAIDEAGNLVRTNTPLGQAAKAAYDAAPWATQLPARTVARNAITRALMEAPDRTINPYIGGY